ncbi:hypothetical protein BJP27_24250 (plasmid) [Pseudomonas oryzihabitans]|nr:hypothetical protein BJP27_24250 [Pseudomonas psychrotolerans]
MNVMLAFTALGLVLGVLSLRWYRMTPTAQNRIAMLVLGVLSGTCILAGQLTWSHFDLVAAQAKADQRRIAANAAADEALAMAQVLGGPDGYIEYLKAKGAP